MYTRQWVDFRPLKGEHGCDNCSLVFAGSDVEPITDFFQRVEPGGIVPSGVCPKCGALCYPIKKENDDAGKVPGEGLHKAANDS